MDGLTRIGNPAQDAFTAHDEAYRSRMSQASAALLRAIERTRTGKCRSTPRDFLWHEHTYVGGALAEPESENSRLAPLRVAALLDEKERVRSLVVKRDPCPRCGTRMDIGCEHVRVA